MYRRSKFLETLLEIRCEMASDVDYDVVLFAEAVRIGRTPPFPPQRTSASNSSDLAGAEPNIVSTLVRSNDS